MTDSFHFVGDENKVDETMFRSNSMKSLIDQTKIDYLDESESTILDDVVNAYNTRTDEMKCFFQADGDQPMNIDCGDNPTEVLIGHNNAIQSVDWHHVGGEKTIHTVEKEDSRYAFLKMSNDRLLVVDQEQIQVVDNKQKVTLASLATSEIFGNGGEPVNYISIELIQDETHLVLLTKDQITKVDISERDSMKVAYKWTNGYSSSKMNQDAGKIPFWHMQILEDKNQLWVSQTSHDDDNFTDIHLLELSDLSYIHKIIGETHDFYHVGSFFYSPKNSVLFCKEQTGRLIRLYDTDSDNVKRDILKMIDGADSTSQKQAFQMYEEKNILFQGGSDMIIAIDVPDREIVAKFKVRGDVYSMKITKDRRYLLVVTSDSIDGEAPINYFYKISLRKIHQTRLNIEGVKCVAQSKTDANLLYLVEGSQLKSYDVLRQSLSEVIADVGNQSEEPKSLDVNEKYCFQIGNQENEIDIVKRFDLKTGEVQVLTDGLQNLENFIIYSMNVINPTHYPNGLCIVTGGQNGTHFIDCETLENIFTYSVRSKSDYYIQQVFVKSENLVFIGSQKGSLYLIDISDIQKLKSQDEEESVFTKTSSGISALEVSPYPKEQYLAIGTEHGTMHIHKMRFIRQRKSYRYLDMNIHVTPIRGFNFISAGDDYLLSSFSENGNINVICLRERVSVYRNDSVPNGVQNMIYSDMVNSFFMINRKIHQFYEMQLKFDQEFFSKFKDEINSDLDLNMKRRFFRQSQKAVQLSCLKHFEMNNILAFRKLNLFSIAALMGRSQALKIAADNFDMFMNIDGQTLIQICGKTNDVDCIDLCMKKLAEGNGTVNWQTLCQILQSPETDNVKSFLTKYQIIKPDYNFQATEMLPIKGKIKIRNYESQNIILNPEMIMDMVDVNVKENEFRQITIQRLCTMVNMNLGSQTCIEILAELEKANSSNLQHGENSLYVQALWEKYRTVVRIYSFINFLQFILLALSIIIDPFDVRIMMVNSIYSIFMLLIECRQIFMQGRNYFKYPFNYLDNLGNILVIEMYVNLLNHGKRTYLTETSKMYLIFSLMMIGMRALSQLRILKNFRVLINLITATMGNMAYFTSVMLMFILITTVSNSLNHIKYHENDQQRVEETDAYILAKIGMFYQMILGVMPNGADLTGLEWFMYIFFTVLVNIIMKNLLISILGDTFGKVMDQIDVVHFRTKVEILNEVQDLMFWNRNKNELVYLYFVNYAGQAHTPNKEGDDDFQGKIKMFTKKLGEVKSVCQWIKHESSDTLKMQNDTERKVQNMLHEQAQINHHIDGGMLNMQHKLETIDKLQRQFVMEQDGQLEELKKIMEGMTK